MTSERSHLSRRSFLRRSGALVGGAWLAPVMVACGADNNTKKTEAGLTVFEQLFYRPTPAPEGCFFWLADVLGYWKEEDLKVSMQMTKGSPDSVRLLGTGVGDLAIPSSDAVLPGWEKGLEVTDFYCHMQRPIFAVGVPEESSVKSPADLAGKRVGVLSQGSSTVPIVNSLVRDAGLDPQTDIAIIATGVGATPVEALRQKKVDAVAYHDTQFLLFERAGFKFRFFPTEFDKFFSAGLVVREKDIEEYSDVLGRYARAFTKAVVFAFENPAAAVDLAAERVPDLVKDREMSIALLKRRQTKLELPKEANGKWGWNTHERWTELQDFLLREKVMKRKQDVKRVFTSKFLDVANDFDEAAIRKKAGSYSSKGAEKP